MEYYVTVTLCISASVCNYLKRPAQPEVMFSYCVSMLVSLEPRNAPNEMFLLLWLLPLRLQYHIAVDVTSAVDRRRLSQSQLHIITCLSLLHVERTELN